MDEAVSLGVWRLGSDLSESLSLDLGLAGLVLAFSVFDFLDFILGGEGVFLEALAAVFSGTTPRLGFVETGVSKMRGFLLTPNVCGVMWMI